MVELRKSFRKIYILLAKRFSRYTFAVCNARKASEEMDLFRSYKCGWFLFFLAHGRGIPSNLFWPEVVHDHLTRVRPRKIWHAGKSVVFFHLYQFI